MDNLGNTSLSLTLTFDHIFARFGEIYWDLIFNRNLHQNNRREIGIEKLIQNLANKYDLESPISYYSLPSDIKLEYQKLVKDQCSCYVIGAMYADTKNLFYSFNKKGEWIRINPQMYAFICEHKAEFNELNSLAWAGYLEKINKPSIHDTAWYYTSLLESYEISSQQDKGTTGLEETASLSEQESITSCGESSQEKAEQVNDVREDTSSKTLGEEEEIDTHGLSLVDNPFELIRYLREKHNISSIY